MTEDEWNTIQQDIMSVAMAVNSNNPVPNPPDCPTVTSPSLFTIWTMSMSQKRKVQPWAEPGVKSLHGAHSGGPARKPATSSSSRKGTSCDIPSNSTQCHAADGNGNRSVTANQCARLGVPMWPKRVATDSWMHQLHH